MQYLTWVLGLVCFLSQGAVWVMAQEPVLEPELNAPQNNLPVPGESPPADQPASQLDSSATPSTVPAKIPVRVSYRTQLGQALNLPQVPVLGGDGGEQPQGNFLLGTAFAQLLCEDIQLQSKVQGENRTYQFSCTGSIELNLPGYTLKGEEATYAEGKLTLKNVILTIGVSELTADAMTLKIDVVGLGVGETVPVPSEQPQFWRDQPHFWHAQPSTIPNVQVFPFNPNPGPEKPFADFAPVNGEIKEEIPNP